MATFTDTIRFVVEAATGQAQGQLRSLRTDLAQAEGAGGKMRAGIAGIGGALRDNLGLGLAGAGAAVSAFVGKSVSEFQDLALQVDKFSAASGLALEEASRWVEVSEDLGVNADTFAGAVNRLNRAAAEGKLDELGIQADNANDRVLKTLEYLQGITDETERARLGTELLGRGWTELSPLIDAASDLRGELAKVSEAKVIDQAEVDKAKRYREAMDELKGVLEDIQLSLGSSLVPLLADTAGALKFLSDIIGAIPDLPDWADWVLRNNPAYWLNRGREYFEDKMETGLFPRGLESTAGLAPAGTPGTNPVPQRLGQSTTIINPPPGYRGDEIDSAQRNFWQTNGRVTWTGQG